MSSTCPECGKPSLATLYTVDCWVKHPADNAPLQIHVNLDSLEEFSDEDGAQTHTCENEHEWAVKFYTKH